MRETLLERLSPRAVLVRHVHSWLCRRPILAAAIERLRVPTVAHVSWPRVGGSSTVPELLPRGKVGRMSAMLAVFGIAERDRLPRAPSSLARPRIRGVVLLPLPSSQHRSRRSSGFPTVFSQH